MMTVEPDPEIVNVQWIATLLGCSRMTVNRYIEAGIIPEPFKLGRDRLWVKSELIAHVLKVARRD